MKALHDKIHMKKYNSVSTCLENFEVWKTQILKESTSHVDQSWKRQYLLLLLLGNSCLSNMDVYVGFTHEEKILVEMHYI